MIIVEDGTNIPGANSYVTVAELATYAAERGIVLPAEDPAKEVLLIKAMDYLELMSADWVGSPTFTGQPLDWPRTYYSSALGIPPELKKAQMVLAAAAMTIDLTPVSSGVSRSAKRQTVGPITVEYSTSGGSSYPRVPQADLLLGFLKGSSLGSGQLRVVRA